MALYHARRSIPTAWDPGSAIDLWVGGPGADGRGLDEANGGHKPLPGLVITSPTADGGLSASSRVLIRDADHKWHPKAAGVLAGIGGRVWTSPGWTYAGATDPFFLGPLPALSLGVTNSIRRFTTSGPVTVQDVIGIVHTYAQRVSVAAGNDGTGLALATVETYTNLAAGEQIYWHLLIETFAGIDELALFGFGIWSGSAFVKGPVWVDPDAGTVEQRAGRVVYRGVGPNGGKLYEVWVALVWDGSTLSSAQPQARLLRTIDIHPARTYVVHNLAVYRLPPNVGRWWDAPSFVLVSTGAAASLAAETLTFWFPGTNVGGGWQSRGRRVTFAAQLDATNLPLDWQSAIVLRSPDATSAATLSLLNASFGYGVPTAPLGVVTDGEQRLWVGFDDGAVLSAWRNGVLSGQVQIAGMPAAPTTWMIGGGINVRGLFSSLRRLLGWRDTRPTKSLPTTDAIVAQQSGGVPPTTERGRGPDQPTSGSGGSSGSTDNYTMELRTYKLPASVQSHFGNMPFAASMISTELSFGAKYGYWEARFRLRQMGKGHHFAIWLLPTDNTWPPEIDIMEVINNDENSSTAPLSIWYTNAHGSSRGLEQVTVNNPFDWHRVGFEWTPTTMRWYYDGVVVREQPNYINKPMYFLASWEVGSNWPGMPNDSTPWPGRIEFDYVRYYSPQTGANEPGVPPGYALTWYDEFRTRSIGENTGDNFAPRWVYWNVRYLSGNNDKGYKVADHEIPPSSSQTYQQILASTGLYGSGPFFHVYNVYSGATGNELPSPTRTINVSNVTELNNALTNAQPGDHIVLANGTYNLGGQMQLTKSGTLSAPIVVRAANVLGAVLPGGFSFATGVKHVYLWGLDFRGAANNKLRGQYNIIRRCRIWPTPRLNGYVAGIQPEFGSDCRIDYCELRLHTDAEFEAEFGSQSFQAGSEYRIVHAWYSNAQNNWMDRLTIERCHIRGGLNTKHTSYDRPFHSGIVLDGNLTDGLARNTGWRIRLCYMQADMKFVAIEYKIANNLLDRVHVERSASAYVAVRYTGPTTIRRCRFTNGLFYVMGGYHTIDNSLCGNWWVFAGTCAYNDYSDRNKYPQAYETKMRRCQGSVTVGQVFGDGTGWNFPATNTYLEAHSGSVTLTSRQTNTVQSGSSSISAEDPITLSASVVGPFAPWVGVED